MLPNYLVVFLQTSSKAPLKMNSSWNAGFELFLIVLKMTIRMIKPRIGIICVFEAYFVFISLWLPGARLTSTKASGFPPSRSALEKFWRNAI